MAFSFFGGVHPKENKWYACDKEIQPFPAPDVVVIPMSQHIGAPCKPLVKKGDLVTMGQKIGDNQGLCVPVHASVSGKVKAVEARPHTSGTTVMSVVIENDHQNTLCPDIQGRTQEAVDALTNEQLIDIIRECGVVGMGGATFPTHAKISSGLGKVDTIIVNAGECEPYITSDDRLCREMPEKVISGLKVLMRIFGLKEGHIGIEDNKPEAIAKMREYFAPKGIFENELYPGIPELLADTAAAGCVNVMATSKPEPFARRIAEHFDIARHFRLIAGSDLDGSRTSKAEVIRHALAQLRIAPEEAVMIGDRRYDIEGAAAAGLDSVALDSVAVGWGYAAPGELEAARPGHFAADVGALRRLLL